MLEISVIIACFNGAETLAETLASLVIQEWSRSWEIVLADNGSTDASVQIFTSLAAARPDVRMRVVDAGREKGKSFALNTAIRAARGRSILFCDADDTVAPGWLAAMGTALDRHPFVAARIDLRKLSPEWTLASRGLVQQDQLRRLPYPPHALVAGGATLGFHREVFDRAGGFDPAFPVMEDIDFCIRAHLAGYGLAFVPEAVYHYRFRGDLEGIRRQSYGYNYYRALLRRRYGAEPLLTFRPWALLAGRALRLARRRVALAVGPREASLVSRAALARDTGQLWGQVRGALAFRVAPPRPQPDDRRARSGNMALTPPA
jgi:glycosyltransferase involved in cell wall biosynthesis